MAEYIERDKTLQDMHSSHSTPIFIGHKTDEDIMFERMCGIVMEQPTADVVEVVRCKDCKHATVNYHSEKKPLICCLTKMCGTVNPNWYCADGEKENEMQH